MLKFPQKKTKWFGKAQSGFYIDFFLKKICDLFIRNIFIFSAVFFGEKYIVEKLTRKVVDVLLFKSNKIIGFTILNFRLFMYMFITFLLYSIFFLNILIILYY